jgi:hypothetical protein
MMRISKSNYWAVAVKGGTASMSPKIMCQLLGLVLLLACAISAGADEKSDYLRRAAADDTALFHSLDRDTDGSVTRLEAQGDVDFLPRFDDMDINMDGVVTTAELQRYLGQRYEIRGSNGQPRNSGAPAAGSSTPGR